MAMTLCELKWLPRFLVDLLVPVTRPILLYCDSQAAIYITTNPVFPDRTKHSKIDCHIDCDAFQASFITPTFVRSVSQPVDILSKALHSSQFRFLARKLGICDLYSPTCEDVLRYLGDYLLTTLILS